MVSPIERVPLVNDDSEEELTTNFVRPALTIPTPTGPTFFTFKYFMYSLATLSSVAFVATVWYIIFNAEYTFFVWHPFLMSTTVFLFTQGILLLQQTETTVEKQKGVDYHRLIQTLAFLSGLSGFTIVFYNKVVHEKDHFASSHAISGALTLSLVTVQLVAGGLMLNFPGLFGGVNRAKSMYKYHRVSGYLIFFLLWLTAFGGTQRDWVTERFNHQWIWAITIVATLVGVAARTRLSKMKIL